MKHLSKMIAVVALMGASLQALAAPTLVTGAGATFPSPLYVKWMAEYRKVQPDVQMNYQSIGSGGGVRQFLAGTTDFGASDEPMSDAEMQQARDGVVHIPMTLGAVVITYNLPGVKDSLKLSTELLVDIFMGKITKWNDPKIKALNPKANFPDLPLIVCHRADGSGTTAVFAEYMSMVSREWFNGVGRGKSVKFPVGLGGKGNEGVMGLIRQNPGAIGYVEMTYARVNKLPMAELKNKAGEYVAPSLDSVTAAAASIKDISDDLRIRLINPPGAKSYPLSSYSFLLVRRKMDATKGPLLKKFVQWALTDGQSMAPQLDYAKLPEVVARKAEKALQMVVTP